MGRVRHRSRACGSHGLRDARMRAASPDSESRPASNPGLPCAPDGLPSSYDAIGNVMTASILLDPKATDTSSLPSVSPCPPVRLRSR